MNKYTHQIIVRFILAALTILCAPFVMADEIATEISRNPVAMNESFQLQFKASSSPDDDPDFTPLNNDFNILNQSKSQNIQMINGDFNRNIVWSLDLMAKHAGTLTIPAISFGDDQSKPLELTVTKAEEGPEGKAGEDIFLKVELAPESVYVQQQMLLKIMLYRAVNLGNASLSEPTAITPDVIIKKLGEDRQFESTVAGRRYLITERVYALFPQKSGSLGFDPILFQGEITRGSSRNGLFGQFGQQRFDLKRLQVEIPAIDVKPLPALRKGQPWLPSDNLQLVETWGEESPEFRVGEPVTRTLIMFADGLTSAQLPALSKGKLGGIKSYPDQPALKDNESTSGITGIRQEKVALVPTAAGQFELPAISFEWWNTDEERMETAQIPARTIQVLPKINDGSTTKPPAEQIAPAPISPVTSTDKINNETVTVVTSEPGYLLPLSIFLGIGWLLTLIAWWYSKKTQADKPHTAEPTQTKVKNISRKQLKEACLSENPQQASEALIQWVNGEREGKPIISLGQIISLIENNEAIASLKSLEQQLYANQNTPWTDGEKLWATIEKLSFKQNGNKVKRTEEIQPLYPA